MRMLSRLVCLSLFALGLGVVNAQTKDNPADKSKGYNPALKPADRLKEGWWKKRHDDAVANFKDGGVDVLFVGDSITQGWEGAGKKVWEESFKDWKPGNIGFSGDQTQHVLWRITEGKEIEKIDPMVVVIMIGTNNIGNSNQTAQQTAAGVFAIVKEFQTQKPKAKILLLGVFPRASKKPDDKEATEVTAANLQPKIADINAVISTLHDGKTVHYLDIGKVFLDDKGNLPKKIMPDYLHLSADGYAKWAAAIKAPVEKLLK